MRKILPNLFLVVNIGQNLGQKVQKVSSGISACFLLVKVIISCSNTVPLCRNPDFEIPRFWTGVFVSAKNIPLFS